jgi:hypothetical protein
MAEQELSGEEVFEGIKEEAKAPDRMAKDTGDSPRVSWDAMSEVLAMPDQRPAPTRIKAANNPEKNMGVLLAVGKQQSYAPSYAPSLKADKEALRVKARKMGDFSEDTIAQAIQLRMKGTSKVHVYLSEQLPAAFQLEGQMFNKDIIILAPRYLSWEQGKHAWLVDEFEGESGWAIGGQPSYQVVISKFIKHLTFA